MAKKKICRALKGCYRALRYNFRPFQAAKSQKGKFNLPKQFFLTPNFLQVSELFGGLEVCGLLVAAGKDAKEYILKASDSTFPLMGDTQEEDRRNIAELVSGRMQASNIFSF